MGLMGTRPNRMNLIIFPLLCKESQKAMLRTNKRYGAKAGHPYIYEPNGRLLKRLSIELSVSKEEVRSLILDERKYLILRNSIAS